MIPRRFSFCLLAFCLSALGASSARAQVVSTATFDENANGSLVTTLAGVSNPHLTSGMRPDPGPGGLSSALTYDLVPGQFPTVLTAGDLFLFDTGSPLALSDVIRFNPSGIPGISPTVVFYSLAPGTDLADTGFPTQLYSNNFSIAENPSGPTTYTPTVGQPGYDAGLNITYVLNSPAAVPEPTTLGLLGVGTIFAVLIFCRKTS